MISRLILVGDSGVGKSSALRRYFDDGFTDNFNTTIGVDFKSKEIIKDKLKIQIWDTAGQERFKSITSSYYKNAHCVILFFDTTNKKSFDNLQYWYDEVHKYNSTNPIFILVGTKKDLKDHRQVYPEVIKNFITPKNIKYFEISSKLNENIFVIFDYAIELLKNKPIPEKPKNSFFNYVNMNEQEKTRNNNKEIKKNNYWCC